MDLVRAILLQVEEKSIGLGCPELSLPGYTSEAIAYHVMLLKEAGLLEAIDLSNNIHGLSFKPKRLTWKGHEFLDAVKSDTVWNKVKTTVVEKGASLTLDVAMGLALRFAKTMVGLP